MPHVDLSLIIAMWIFMLLFWYMRYITAEKVTGCFSKSTINMRESDVSIVYCLILKFGCKYLAYSMAANFPSCTCVSRLSTYCILVYRLVNPFQVTK